MQFKHYKENLNAYLDNYYSKLIVDLKQRPERSYPVIFEDELSAIKRYSHSLFNEVLFHMREALEESLSPESAEREIQRVASLIEQQGLVPISYEPRLLDSEGSTIVRVSESGEHMQKAMVKPSDLKTPAISGTLAGGVLGGVIGKSVALAAAGAVSGGVVAGTAAFYLLQKNIEQNRRVHLKVKKEPEKADVVSLIENRKQQVESYFIQILNTVEDEFIKMKRDSRIS
jgi:outer membrane lipoprotein SlyB